MNSGSMDGNERTQGDRGTQYSAPSQAVGDALVRPQEQAWQAQPQGQWQGQPQVQPQWNGQPDGRAVAPLIAPKNGGIGVLLSFFIPGLGSMVNGSAGLGALILGVYIVGWILTLVLIGIPIVFGAWIWGMIDGYLSAQRWNSSHGIIS
jgi:TM2 domain-containing membrane protein YozV